MSKDFLSVKEVADFLGCSVQAVYNRLEKDFKPYLKLENGKKVLNSAVLQYIQPNQNSSDFKENFKDVLKLLEKQNEQLQSELVVKNNQLEVKDKQLEVKDKQIEQLQKLLDQQQQLTLMDKQNVLQIEEKSHWWKKKKK